MCPLPCRLLCGVVLLSLLSSQQQLNAQAPAVKPMGPSPAGDIKVTAPLKFTAHTQLVMIPVVVTNRKGEHVTGLTRESFTVEEKGSPRTVNIFEEIKSVAPSMKERALPAQGNSNFTFGNTDTWRVTIVMVDALNTPFLSQTRAKRELINYLAKNLRREEPTALLGLGRNGLKQLYPLTQDTAGLIAALNKVRGEIGADEMNNDDASVQMEADETPGLDPATVSQASADIFGLMQECGAVAAAFQQRNSIRTTLAALQQIAQAYSAIPGRKSLIWASGGFPFMIDDPHSFNSMGTDMVEQYENTWRALSAAGIAVYPVDVTGLKSSGLPASQRGGSRSRIGNPMGVPGVMKIPYDRDAELQATMRAFADATGGQACVNSNDLERCFAHAIDDSSVYYMLGYYLPSDDVRPGWRKLKVRVNAEGAKVHTLSGFYVTAPEENTPAAARRQIVQALNSPVELTGVRINVREMAAPADWKPEAGKTRHEFAVGMPARSITVNAAENNLVDVSVLALAVDAKGHNVGQGDNEVAGKLKQESADKIKRSGMAVQVGVDLAPGTYQMRFAVRDNLKGEVGTVIFPLEVK